MVGGNASPVEANSTERPQDSDEHDAMGGLVDAALEIANGRRETLRQLREALKAEDNTEALRLARRLCGLDEEESHRTDSRLN